MDHDREETCARCGAHHDDHYTAWENGIPIVGSYQDAPNGRVCSNLAEELKAAVLQIEELKKGRATFCIAHGKILCACEKCVEDTNRLIGEYKAAMEKIRKLAAQGDGISSPVLYGLTDVEKRPCPECGGTTPNLACPYCGSR